MFFAIFWPLHILACVFSQQFRLHAKTGFRPYSRLCGRMKVLRSHFYCFFLLVQIKSKTATCSLRYFGPCTFWLACFLNSFGYTQEPPGSSRPYSRLCGKSNTLAFLILFSVNTAQIKDCQMLFAIFWPIPLWLVWLPTVTAILKMRL